MEDMFLNIQDNVLKEMNAYNTAKEITQQPLTWIKTLNVIKENASKITNFLAQLGKKGSYDIVFMGAGTSEYIGNTLVNYFK